jgi:flagellar L-ring protein FlgH
MNKRAKAMKNILMVSLLTFSFCLLTSSFSFSDSIWNDDSTSPYSVTKGFKIGDVITIIILETTSAASNAGTDTNSSDNLALNFNSNLASLYHPSKTIGGGGGNSYTGSGSTTRTNNVTAKVEAVVTKVLPNGNLLITGEHRVSVNQEEQTIKISGMIRPKDVSLNNTIYSYQVAGATVSVQGKGAVGGAQEPGFVSRFFNWLF